MKKFALITLGTAAAVVTVFFVGVTAGKSNITPPAVETASAAYPQEAVRFVEELKNEQKKFGSGQTLIDQGNQLVTRGEAMKNEAAVSARALDTLLCARFQLKFDRSTGQIVSAQDCPLL